jgi:hypothetical protein
MPGSIAQREIFLQRQASELALGNILGELADRKPLSLRKRSLFCTRDRQEADQTAEVGKNTLRVGAGFDPAFLL